MIEWSFIVIGLSLLLLAFLIWKEVNRNNKARLLWRVLSSILAVVSLACIALPIYYGKIIKSNSSNNVILLTEGFESESVTALLKANDKAPVFTLDDKLVASRKFNTKLVSRLSSIRKIQKDVSAIHVYGNGLEADELTDLDSMPIVFHPAKQVTGITTIHWTDKLKTGDKLYIQGSFNNASSSTLKMVLKGFNTTLDSIKINPNKYQTFELTTIPKHAGRSVYSLVVLDGKDTVSNESIPIQIEQGEPLKILLLSSSPDFENKFLKNSLGQKGFKTVTRTLISKGKFTKDFLNTDPLNVDRITPALLSNFNIVIAHATELSSISKGELGTIGSFVATKNLGLIVRASNKSSNAFYSNRFPVASISGSQQQQIRLHLQDTSASFQALSIESPLSIRVQNGTQPLVIDKQNRVFVNSTLYGSGKIIFTTINNTFNWMLAGNQKDYEELWSEILNKSAGKKPLDETWSVSPSLPRVDQPTTISVETNRTDIPIAQVAGTSVYLKNDPLLPYNWSGIFWPTKAGWQPTIQLNGSTFWWYAFDKNDWKTVDAFDKTTRTKQYAFSNQPSATTGKRLDKTHQTEFPKIYFFLLFLICCGYLWFENKIL
ncbi:MAG TPA: hypothetical protein VF622_03450 [Segetibacter sp.]|jgi:hypothetical protein